MKPKTPSWMKRPNNNFIQGEAFRCADGSWCCGPTPGCEACRREMGPYFTPHGKIHVSAYCAGADVQPVRAGYCQKCGLLEKMWWTADDPFSLKFVEALSDDEPDEPPRPQGASATVVAPTAQSAPTPSSSSSASTSAKRRKL